MNTRTSNLILTVVLTTLIGLIVTISYSYAPNRILKLLGGEMPHGVIQLVTYFFFIFGILETIRLQRNVDFQKKGLNMSLLPEKEQFVISADEVNDIKLKMVDMEKTNPYLIVDIIKKACTKFRSNKSVSEALSIVNAQTDINLRNSDTEQNLIKYFAWACQSVGLVGTVIGIGSSLGAANQISSQEGIDYVTSLLAVAFDSTLMALALSIILMYAYSLVSEKIDKLHSDNQTYVIENLINRIYAK
ncbi:MAG: MotA/TolQ/ExbB proton channel family protein [Chitinophagales bacterium]|nr:MotA/TolQ/ExbB proton channel family protein [Chitinophagales bacterium]